VSRLESKGVERPTPIKDKNRAGARVSPYRI
jgi:hypothetical protein